MYFNIALISFFFWKTIGVFCCFQPSEHISHIVSGCLGSPCTNPANDVHSLVILLEGSLVPDDLRFVLRVQQALHFGVGDPRIRLTSDSNFLILLEIFRFHLNHPEFVDD